MTLLDPGAPTSPEQTSAPSIRATGLMVPVTGADTNQAPATKLRIDPTMLVIGPGKDEEKASARATARAPNDDPPKSAEVIVFPRHKQFPQADRGETISPDLGGEDGKGGKGGEPATVAPVAVTNRQFLETIFDDLPAGAVAAVTAKKGDPTQGSWIAYAASECDRICTPDVNTYFNCASFYPNEDGAVSATKAQVAAYHALVLDDVGTKVEASRIKLEPTWMLETSPGNYQVGFKLREPVRDEKIVNALLDRVGAAGLTDKGAKGINRWSRLPDGINGKAKYVKAGVSFACKLFKWNAEVAYSVDELLTALAPDIASPKPEASAPSPAKLPSSQPGDDAVIYTPRPPSNAIVEALKAQNLYKRDQGGGKHDVTCPWVHEHTDALDTGACYFEPDSAYPFGGFKCLHSHGDDFHVAKLIDHLGLDRQAARNKALIRSTEGHLHVVVRAAEHVLSQQPDFYQAGGAIVRVRYDFNGEPALEAVTDTSLTLALAEFCDWQKYDGRKKASVTCDPPERPIRHLLQAKPYKHLREIEGFARQPYYRAGDGRLVFQAGYDGQSRRLAVFDSSKYHPPAPTREAAQEALAVLDGLLEEFHFASEVDRAATLSAVLTAIVRPSLETAPGFHVAAPSPGSGKSLLCNVIARFASASEPLRLPYPKDAKEADKIIFASLLTQPPTIMFDDMTDDWKAHGVINSALTASTITGRILGVSKTATVSTRILFLGSGNNVGPVQDLSRRVATINLNARSESPATLKYERDPMATLHGNRERYVVAGLTIIEAFKAAGSPKSDVLPIASYNGDWANLCRHPLIWLGLPDPASILIEQVKDEPEVQHLRTLFEAWHQEFGDRPTTVGELLGKDAFTELHEAILDLPIAFNGHVDHTRLGWFLKKNRDRPVGEFILEAGPKGKRRTWCVRSLARSTPPLPPSPPLTAPPEETLTGPPEDAF